MAAIAVDARDTWPRCSTSVKVADRLGQGNVAIGHAAGIVAGEAEIKAIPDAGELRVMVDLLGMQRHAGQEPECLAEVSEGETPGQRLSATIGRPAARNVHSSAPLK